VDADVLAAIARWPDVPAVHGWLALTARGEWRLRGEPIRNPAIRDFFGRNYAGDDVGRWFVQNGPQRVYVDLEATPWVYRLAEPAGLLTHTGRAPQELQAAALLDDGRLLLGTDLGPGLLDDRDATAFMASFVDDDGVVLGDRGSERWLAGMGEALVDPRAIGLPGMACRLARESADGLSRRYGFVCQPRADRSDR
jgi:hypothetical protein